jgi:hypothetical protein
MATIASDPALALDPVLFARRAGLDQPDPWQEDEVLAPVPPD